ncbi:MAG: hypothetical protein AAFX93_19260 [Verrucomicrobiota bacterium]
MSLCKIGILAVLSFTASCLANLQFGEISVSSAPAPDNWNLIYGSFPEFGFLPINENIPSFYSASPGSISFGYQWYLVNENQAIDPSFVSSSDPFANNFDNTFKEAFAPIVEGDPFLWAYWLDFDFSSSITPGDYLGWVELEYNSGDLVVLQSVADTSGQGIFAGTTTVVPESKFYSILAGCLTAAYVVVRKRIRKSVSE